MRDTKRAAAPHLFDYCTLLAIRRRWSELINSERRHDLKAYHHLLYLAILGKDWRRAFTPIKRETKLKNGRRPYEAATYALSILRTSYLQQEWIALFNNLLTEETLDVVRARLPKATSDMDYELPNSPYVEVSDE